MNKGTNEQTSEQTNDVPSLYLHERKGIGFRTPRGIVGQAVVGRVTRITLPIEKEGRRRRPRRGREEGEREEGRKGGSNVSTH